MTIALPPSRTGSTAVRRTDKTSGTSDASRTTLDLQAFRAHSEKQLSQFAGSPVTGGRLWFQDGASSTDMPPLFDHAALVFIPDQQPIALPADLKLAYVANLQGTAEVSLVQHDQVENRIRFMAPQGTATLADHVTPEEGQAIVAELQNRFPTMTVQYMGAIGVISLEPKELGDLAKAFALLSDKVQDGSVAAVETAPMWYRKPFVFDEAVDMGDGSKSEKVDLTEKTTVTKAYREANYEFATQPSLAPPFGPGPVPTNSPAKPDPTRPGIPEGDDFNREPGKNPIDVLAKLGISAKDASGPNGTYQNFLEWEERTRK